MLSIDSNVWSVVSNTAWMREYVDSAELLDHLLDQFAHRVRICKLG